PKSSAAADRSPCSPARRCSPGSATGIAFAWKVFIKTRMCGSRPASITMLRPTSPGLRFLRKRNWRCCGGRLPKRWRPITLTSHAEYGNWSETMNAPMKAKQFDRTSQTVGNIVHLEHWNVVINDQRLATLFYIVGLGGTRDPFMFPGLENIWINF